MDTKKSEKSKAQLSMERTAKCKSLVKAKKKKEMELQHQIHNLDLAMAARKAKNIKKKEDKISNRVKNGRLLTHGQRYQRDLSLRPSDRAYDARLYTKMDLNIWEYPDMREWFNSAAPADIEDRMAYKLRPSDTGYMIQL
jgi:hypothetical protein